MHRTIKFHLSFFFLVWAIFSFGQEGSSTISGQLLSKETNEPIPFASIYLKGKPIGTTTNVEGYFVFHVPNSLNAPMVVLSAIGYSSIEKVFTSFEKDEKITLSTQVNQLDEVQISAAKNKILTAKEIVKRAYKAIESNYPTEPYILEGFVRDLQIEDSIPVEYLECAAKFLYKGHKTKRSPQVELVGVRTSAIAEKNPWNNDYERKNSVIDLIEDDFIRYDYGPIMAKKGWKYQIDSILPYDNRLVYKLKGVDKPFQTATLYIDTETFAFVRMELTRQAIRNRSWRRRFTNGALQVYYNVVFEYQEYNGKMYLKYQKEEDGWKIFKGLESKKLLFTQYPKKELFVNNIITDGLSTYPFKRNMDTGTSIENQATVYDETFWSTYNIPQQTSKESNIVRQLDAKGSE